MWLYSEINQNPDPLIGIVSEEDVLRIARTISKENDEFACSRIAFELTLDGESGSANHSEQPILVQALDILDETFLKSKKKSNDEFACSSIAFELTLDGESGSANHSEQPTLVQELDILDETFLKSKKKSNEKKQLEQLYKKIGEIYNLLEDQKTYDVISNTDENFSKDLKDFKQLLPRVHRELDVLLHDSFTHGKRHNNWGTLGRYKIFLNDCVLLYREITGEDFTVDFHRDSKDGKCTPITKGTRFVYEFHNLLNKIATAYSCKNFTDKNFATACCDLRNQLNKDKDLQTKNTQKKH